MRASTSSWQVELNFLNLEAASMCIVAIFLTTFFSNSLIDASVIVIVCVSKNDDTYVLEFARYHLALGFDQIFIYENNEMPRYGQILKNTRNVTVVDFTRNVGRKPAQYEALEHFQRVFLGKNSSITHVMHIDVDEFLVLRKHSGIHPFVSDLIEKNEDVAGIGVNWRFFGDSGEIGRGNSVLYTYDRRPVSVRFVMTHLAGSFPPSRHIKTIFRVDRFLRYNTVHDIVPVPGKHVQNAVHKRIEGPLTAYADFSIAQLNHYKVKSFEEFRKVRKRGRADKLPLEEESVQHIQATFRAYNVNQVADTFARDFYLDVLESLASSSCVA